MFVYIQIKTFCYHAATCARKQSQTLWMFLLQIGTTFSVGSSQQNRFRSRRTGFRLRGNREHVRQVDERNQRKNYSGTLFFLWLEKVDHTKCL